MDSSSSSSLLQQILFLPTLSVSLALKLWTKDLNTDEYSCSSQIVCPPHTHPNVPPRPPIYYAPGAPRVCRHINLMQNPAPSPIPAVTGGAHVHNLVQNVDKLICMRKCAELQVHLIITKHLPLGRRLYIFNMPQCLALRRLFTRIQKTAVVSYFVRSMRLR